MQSNEKKLTGYPSIDRPWLKYYSMEAPERPIPEYTVYDFLLEKNKHYLDNIALSYFGSEISFHELFENIEKAARAFSTIGVKEEDVVIMVAVTIPEIVYSIYALNRIGAISNMIDPRTSAEGIKEYIAEVDAKYILILDSVYDKVMGIIEETNVERVIVVSPGDALLKAKKIAYKVSNIKNLLCRKKDICMKWRKFINAGKGHVVDIPSYTKNKCCLIVHTGGTTGIPKGVMLSNENLNALVIQSIDTKINMQRTHTWLDIMPPFIAYGFAPAIGYRDENNFNSPI